jgi:hypothetical protein
MKPNGNIFGKKLFNATSISASALSLVEKD